MRVWLETSVTILGDLLHFGQVLKPLATINLPKSSTFLGNFCKGVKIYHFLVKSVLGNFYRHLAIFFWSHCLRDRRTYGGQTWDGRKEANLLRRKQTKKTPTFFFLACTNNFPSWPPSLPPSVGVCGRGWVVVLEGQCDQTWSSLVVGDEGFIGPSRKLLCFVKRQKLCSTSGHNSIHVHLI